MTIYCPIPDSTTKTAYTTPSQPITPVTVTNTRGTKTVYAPPERPEEYCEMPPSTSTVVEGPGAVTPPPPSGNTGTNTSNTVTPPAPIQGGLGFKWEGEFELNKQYKAQSPANPLASVVSYMGSSWVAVEDNISQSEENPEYEPSTSTAWELMAERGETGEGALPEEEKSFLDKVGDFWDYLKDTSWTDLLLDALPYIGIAVAGAIIVDKLKGDGEGDGEADTRFTGSPGFVSAGFQLPTVREAITSLCAIEGIDIDVSTLHDEPCTFVIGQVTSIRAILDQLSLAYQFKMVDTGGVLKFVSRTATPVKTLTMDDIGYGSSNSGTPPSPYVAKRFQGIDLPKRVTLEYYSEKTDYHVFTQSTDLYTYEEGQIIQLSVPVTLTDEKAKYITEITAINAHLERMNYSFTTSYKHVDLEAGDVIDTPMGLISITRLNETEEGLLSFEGVDAGASEAINVSNMTVVSPPVSKNIPVSIGYSQGFAIDPPNIDDMDQDVRIYFGVHGYDREGWPGANIYVSENGGASYDLIDTAYQEATMGLVSAATPAAPYHTWDMTTEIIVQLKTNSLISVQDIDVYNGKNWAMVGREMIGFANATLIGEKTYRLSRLLRGRQGTEQFVGNHSADELFMLIDNALVRVEWTKADRDTIKRYKIVTIGSSLDKVEGFDVQMHSNNTVPWQVANAKVVKVGNNFEFSWRERVRFDNELKDAGQTIHDPNWAGYAIQIFAADGTTSKRNVSVTSDTFTYTEAMQIEDFGAVQANVKAAIAQIDAAYGPGYPALVNSN